jgi:hypothetical protein
MDIFYSKNKKSKGFFAPNPAFKRLNFDRKEFVAKRKPPEGGTQNLKAGLRT